jgi:hypothetical protein
MTPNSWHKVAEEGAAWEWGRQNYRRYARLAGLRSVVVALIFAAGATVILIGPKLPDSLTSNTAGGRSESSQNHTGQQWTGHVVNAAHGVYLYAGARDADEDKQTVRSFFTGKKIVILCTMHGRLIQDKSLGDRSDRWYMTEDGDYINALYANVDNGTTPDDCE